MRREITIGRRPFLTPAEIHMLIGEDVELQNLYQALKRLRGRGVLRYAEGSKRGMTLSSAAPDAVADLRGRMPGSVKARKYSFARDW